MFHREAYVDGFSLQNNDKFRVILIDTKQRVITSMLRMFLAKASISSLLTCVRLRDVESLNLQSSYLCPIERCRKLESTAFLLVSD